MKRVLKYQIDSVSGAYKVSMPVEAKILHIDQQGESDYISIWIEGDETFPLKEYEFRVVMTGGDVPEYHRYLASVLMWGGRYCVHVYISEPKYRVKFLAGLKR